MSPWGILTLDKPCGITSRTAVNVVQRLARPAKVGHAGTLDPLARGVLVVCIGAATRLCVLRPLIGFDEVEAVALAEKIGTYVISIRPYPDSCTVFKPRRPKIRVRLEALESAEQRFDGHSMVEEAFTRTQRLLL